MVNALQYGFFDELEKLAEDDVRLTKAQAEELERHLLAMQQGQPITTIRRTLGNSLASGLSASFGTHAMFPDKPAWSVASGLIGASLPFAMRAARKAVLRRANPPADYRRTGPITGDHLLRISNDVRRGRPPNMAGELSDTGLILAGAVGRAHIVGSDPVSTSAAIVTSMGGDDVFNRITQPYEARSDIVRLHNERKARARLAGRPFVNAPIVGKPPGHIQKLGFVNRLKKLAEYERTPTYTKSDGTVINVGKLWELVADRKPTRVRLDKLHPSTSRRSGYSKQRLENADTKYPILLGVGYDRYIDGRHRTIKLKRLGRKTILAHWLTEEELSDPRLVVKKAEYDKLEKIAAKGVATKTNPSLWARAKAQAKAKMGGKHSARAMQLATQIYKKGGGGYSGSKPSASSNKMVKWTKQKWRTRPGTSPIAKKESGRTSRYLPEKKWKSLSKGEQVATDKKKLSSSNQFVSNTPAARVKSKHEYT